MTSGRSTERVLRVNALRVEQRPDIPLFVFGINGRLIQQFAAVQSATRNDDGVLVGYQRTRVQRHIQEIFNYLSQEGALLPNAIVLAFDNSVEFTPLDGALRVEWGTFGRLAIPLASPGNPKPALIVDGQQRMSALADLRPDRKFPVVVVGFSAASEALQREQFVLVNKSKPLPRDLLNELVPHVDTALPKPWRLRRVAGQVVELLRYDKGSPFYGRIRGIGATGEGANISQAAILEVIQRSVRRAGVLSHHYSTVLDEGDVRSMAEIISVYFTGVARVWPSAWNGSPWSSRLVHGVGIYAVGSLMDVVMREVDASAPRAIYSVERRLLRLKKRCAWTSGRWPALRCAWNELQNTSQDKRRLAEYLLEEYRRARR
jgi:DGQHR domain-containing protein